MTKQIFGNLELEQFNFKLKKQKGKYLIELDTYMLENDQIFGQLNNTKNVQTYQGTDLKWTGFHMNVQKVQNLVVLDFDLFDQNTIDKDFESLRNKFLEIMKLHKFYVEVSVNKGFHVYLFNDYFVSKNNSRVDAQFKYTGNEKFKLDIFYQKEFGNKQKVCVTGTKSQLKCNDGTIKEVRPLIEDEDELDEIFENNENNSLDLLQYYDGKYLKVSKFLEIMKININQREQDVEYEEKNTELENIDKKDFVKKVVESNKQIESTNDWKIIVINSTKLLNRTLKQTEIEEILSPIFRKDKTVTDYKSTRYWIDIFYSEQDIVDEILCYNILRKYLKVQKVQTQIEEPRFLTINILDEINLFDLKQNQNKNLQDILNMMKQIIGYSIIDGLYILKREGSDEKPIISYVKKETMRDYLSPIKTQFLNELGKKKSIWNIFEEYEEMFQYKKIQFYSKDKFSNFSLFNWYYKSIENQTKIQLYLDHIFNVICSKDEQLFEYLQNWISYIVQNPGKKNQSALVLQSKQGTGKNIFTNVICQLFGYLFSLPNSSGLKNVTGQFNHLLMNKMLVVINEMSNSENKHEDMNVLKQLITEDQIEINQKFVDTRQVQNVSNFIILSNNLMPVYLEESDRRYVVIQVSNEKIGNTNYFEKLVESTKQEGFYEALRYYYENRFIQKFKSQEIPKTQAKQQLLQLSKTPAMRFLEQKIQETDQKLFKEEGILRSELIQEYKQFLQQENIKQGQLKFIELEWKEYLILKNAHKENNMQQYYLK